jgi:hypothetical protein
MEERRVMRPKDNPRRLWRILFRNPFYAHCLADALQAEHLKKPRRKKEGRSRFVFTENSRRDDRMPERAAIGLAALCKNICKDAPGCPLEIVMNFAPCRFIYERRIEIRLLLDECLTPDLKRA